MKPFNVEDAMAGARVVNDRGDIATLNHVFEIAGTRRLLFLFHEGTEYGVYFSNGKNASGYNGGPLFMAEGFDYMIDPKYRAEKLVNAFYKLMPFEDAKLTSFGEKIGLVKEMELLTAKQCAMIGVSMQMEAKLLAYSEFQEQCPDLSSQASIYCKSDYEKLMTAINDL